MAALVVLAPTASAQEVSTADTPFVVVTTEVLGSVVSDLVDGVAEVKVLMPPGSDPHTWQPSARDTEAVFAADFVVANGLGLEQGLVAILEQATSAGVPVFEAADYVRLRQGDEPGHDESVVDDHEAADPHFWLDPAAMRDVVIALGAALSVAGIEVDASTSRLASDLVGLDAEIASILSVVPADQRKLVTGHDSLGYFADRYGFTVVGTVIPGLTTSLEPSARDLAQLIAAIRAEGVSAVFTEVATPQSVARVVADEAGAQVVELDVGQLSDAGSYADFMRALAQTIASALAG